jgi:hypothetical protein
MDELELSAAELPEAMYAWLERSPPSSFLSNALGRAIISRFTRNNVKG